jgi:hypothetical protein
MRAEFLSISQTAVESEAGKDATLNAVMEKFAVESRLGSMLDACVKRLLHLRGFKSLSSSSAPLLPRPDGDKAA